MRTHRIFGRPGDLRGGLVKAARVAGVRLKRDPHVRQVLARELAKLALTRERVLEELGILAFAVLADVITYEPGRGFELLPDALRHPALESIKEWTDTEGQRRIRGVSLRGRTEALMLLARYFKLVGDGKPWDGVQNITVVIEKPEGAAPKPIRGEGAARPVVVDPGGLDGGGRRALAAPLDQLDRTVGGGFRREAGDHSSERSASPGERGTRGDDSADGWLSPQRPDWVINSGVDPPRERSRGRGDWMSA